MQPGPSGMLFTAAVQIMVPEVTVRSSFPALHLPVAILILLFSPVRVSDSSLLFSLLMIYHALRTLFLPDRVLLL